MSSNLYLTPGWYQERRTWPSTSSILRSTTFCILLVGFSAWIISYRHFTVASARDPTSYFFNPAKGYQRLYSLDREKEAYAYLKDYNHTNVSPPAAPEHPFICAGIATIARPSQEQYVRGAVGSLLQGLTDAQRQTIHLTTFVAHTDPTAHPIYREPWLKGVSNEVLTYDVPETELAQLRLFEEQHHPRNKSMYDYGYLLQSCLRTGAKYVAILEDDVIARDGWYKMATSSLQKIEAGMGTSPWLYLRMFYTEILLGWNGEEWLKYAITSLCLFTALLVILHVSRTRSPLLKRHISNLDIWLLCGFYLPAFIILYFMAGRVTMQPPRAGVSLMPRFGCCSQGFIFPRQIVPQVIERTKQAMDEDYYIDMLLERYADKEKLRRYVHYPSLLQHVGNKSSKGHGYDEHAGEIFNFGFEIKPP